ncbi:hypothetical protein MY11210_005037 [Beauveria gryllotalpidicola]
MAPPEPGELKRLLASTMYKLSDTPYACFNALPTQQSFAQGMRRLKAQVTYDSFIGVLDNSPDIYEPHATTLNLVRDMARHNPSECQD